MSSTKHPTRPAMHDAMRIARLHAGLTQTELARRAGTTQVIVSRAEAGINVPHLYTVCDCARVLGITVDEYVGLL